MLFFSFVRILFYIFFICLEVFEICDGTQSFLERDNFEKELGYADDDPFAEDFSDISQHDIITVIADGDRVARLEILYILYIIYIFRYI